MYRFLLSFLALTMCSCCTRVMSEQTCKIADLHIKYADLRNDTDRYLGKTVLLGGIIAGVKNAREGGQLEIADLDLGSDGIPENDLQSPGRFLATAPYLLDTMIYRKGRMVTVAGEVKGERKLPLDETVYNYPVISIREIHVWENPEPEYMQGPYVFDPYYSGYPLNPYLYRPLGPPFGRW